MTITLICNTKSCTGYGHASEEPDNGVQVLCGGSCGNVLQPEDQSNPNFPHIEPDPDPAPSLEELVDQRLKDLGII